MFPLFNFQPFGHEGEMKTVKIKTPFGHMTFSSNQWDDQTLQHFQQQIGQIQAPEDFHHMKEQMMKQMGFPSLFSFPFEGITGMPKIGFFSPFAAIQEKAIDQQIETLQQMKQTMQENKQNQAVAEQKRQLHREITKLQYQLEQKSLELLEKLDMPEENQRINADMLSLHQQIKQLKQQINEM